MPDPTPRPDFIDELSPLRQWLGWKYEPPLPGSDKPRKVPYSPLTEMRAATTRPATWSDLATALDAKDRNPDWAGVGFVFTSADPYTGVDLDGCRDPETGTVAEWAMEIVRRLDSYTEVSPSGSGLHIFVRATLPAFGRRKGKVELYESERYFTVSAQALPDTPACIERRQAEIEALHAELFGALDEMAPRIVRHGPMRVSPDDGRLIDRMFACAAGTKIRALWNGDTSMHEGDDSRADLALCDYLAFWTAGDAARVDRLFRQSGLMRDKWDEKRGALTYGERTIAYAVSGKPVGGDRAA